LCQRFGDASRLPALEAAAAVAHVLDALITPTVPAPKVPSMTLVEPPAAPVSPVDEPFFTNEERERLKLSVSFADFTAHHERALAYMRWRRQEAVEKDDRLTPSAEMASDTRLLRFLIATGFVASEAAIMYIDALRWRAERKVDTLRDELVAANPGFFGGRTKTLQKPVLGAVDCAMMQSRPRTFFREAADGTAELLFDREGNLVYIEVPATVDPMGVAAIGDPQYTQAELRMQELLQLIIDELSRRSGRLILIFRIIDLLSMSLTQNPFRSSVIKQGEVMVKAVGKEIKESYPSTTSKNFIVNAPAGDLAKPVITAMMPARSRNKTVIEGGKYQAALHSFVEPSQLPQKLGGILDDGMQWEKKKKK